MIIIVMAATDADADEEMIAGIPGTSGGTKRRAGNMASMLDNLYTEFKKSIETSIVQKIRTVKEINVYILFLSICSWTFFIQKCWTKQWHQKARWKYGLYVWSRRQSLHRIQKKLLRHPLFQKFGQLWK